MRYIIILAAGIGSRCGQEVPKQYALVGGKPIICHTLDLFRRIFLPRQIVLVLHPDHKAYWDFVCQNYRSPQEMRLVYGGDQRFHSVRNALASIDCKDEDIIGIHDAVRPFVSDKTVRRVFEAAAIFGASLPVINVTNTIRRIEVEKNFAEDRQALKVVQTPQVFKARILKKAYEQPYHPQFHDCATVVEHAGFPIELTEGNYENIKITHPQDLYIGEAIYYNINNGIIPDQGKSREKIYGNL
jgi:2-C-methyl-D-erythritol 4-phosphate cytidylyltransferase